MADTLLFRGGSSADIAASTVQARELVIDTDTDQIVSGTSKKKTVMEGSDGELNSLDVNGGNITLASSGGITTNGTITIERNTPAFLLTKANATADIGTYAITVNADSSLLIQGRNDAGTGSGSYFRFTRVSASNAIDAFVGLKNATPWFEANNTDQEVRIGGTLPSAPNITLASGGAITAGTYNTLTVGRGSGDIASNTVTGNGALAANTTGINNTAVGRSALAASSAGDNNTAVGSNALITNTEGASNTATGFQSLRFNTTGGNNSAFGWRSLYSNTVGGNNTALGRESLYLNTIGSRNAALGYQSGYYIEGNNNTILGAYQGTAADSTLSNTVIISAGITERMRIDSSGDVLIGGTLPSAPNITLASDGAITAGTYNTLTVGSPAANSTAVGVAALASVATGTSNVAFGNRALRFLTAGANNLAVGYQALTVADGSNNTVVGNSTLNQLTTGGKNCALGAGALSDNISGNFNTAIGFQSGQAFTGSSNTVLGAYVGTASDSTLNDTVVISAGTAERARCHSTGIWNLGTSAPVYADNAAAKTGGLVDGDIYRKSDGTLMIVFT